MVLPASAQSVSTPIGPNADLKPERSHAEITKLIKIPPHRHHPYVLIRGIKKTKPKRKIFALFLSAEFNLLISLASKISSIP